MGIDNEEKTTISILQVANAHNIYLFDIFTLDKVLNNDQKRRFCDEFLTNRSIIKLGLMNIL